jgi:tetratricopeptide (TPR) repeat protein
MADAMKMIAAKDYAGARKVLVAIVSQNENDTEARYRLSAVLAGRFHELDEAEALMERAVELADKNAEYHFFLGTVYGSQAQEAGLLSKLSYARKTRDQFERAVELQPDSVRYRQALFTYYLMAPGIVGGGVEKARTQAAEILMRAPYDGHMALAQIGENEKNDSASEQEYKLAIAANPDGWRAHHMLGYLFLRSKRVDQAIAQFKERYRPHHAEDARSPETSGRHCPITG